MKYSKKNIKKLLMWGGILIVIVLIVIVFLYIINKFFIKEKFEIICDDTNSYYDKSQNNCIKCPNDSYYDKSQNNCIKCPNDSYVNNNKTGCITCPNNSYVNNDKTGCVISLDNIINSTSGTSGINYTQIDNILNSTIISDNDKFNLVYEAACNKLGPFYDFKTNTYYFNMTTKNSVNWSLDKSKKNYISYSKTSKEIDKTLNFWRLNNSSLDTLKRILTNNIKKISNCLINKKYTSCYFYHFCNENKIIEDAPKNCDNIANDVVNTKFCDNQNQKIYISVKDYKESCSSPNLKLTKFPTNNFYINCDKINTLPDNDPYKISFNNFCNSCKNYDKLKIEQKKACVDNNLFTEENKKKYKEENKEDCFDNCKNTTQKYVSLSSTAPFLGRVKPNPDKLEYGWDTPWKIITCGNHTTVQPVWKYDQRAPSTATISLEMALIADMFKRCNDCKKKCITKLA